MHFILHHYRKIPPSLTMKSRNRNGLQWQKEKNQLQNKMREFSDS